MRCPVCQTMNPPSAKFCFECGTRFLICPNCGTFNPLAAKFCIECGNALSVGGNTAPLPALNNEEQTLTPSEERRIVTVLFADITGSTPLADHLDPEDMRAILAAYFNLMTEQIRKHGGTVEKYIGDAVMAIFGAPIAHEDDPDRAIRAAIDMYAALATFNERRLSLDPNTPALQMRIGINTGEVAIPSNVLHNRRDFLITGDAVNVAARLQQVATPDTILVGERTYLATREVFDFRPIAPLQLKGKAEQVPAWVVIGLQDETPAIPQHPRGIEGLQADFIGRSLELTLMHATYARVQAEQRPHLITLIGAPGIGKSRLVREFIQREQQKAKSTSSLERLPSPMVLQGRCPPYGEGITYWPLVEILRSLLQAKESETDGVLRDRFIEFVQETLSKAKRTEDPVEIATAIIRSIGRELSGNATEQTSGERRERERQRTVYTRVPDTKNAEQLGPQAALFRAWRIFVEALAYRQSLILVIDDLQWADEALLALLEYLMDRVMNVPILLLCPARSDLLERKRDWGGGRRNFTTIALEALSREECSELISALLHSDELPEVLHQTILNRAEGNPFFVEEIVRMLIDQQVLIFNDGHWHIGTQGEGQISALASPAGLPDDTLLDQHYILPLPRVPDTIQGVLAARIDLLSPLEKRVLQYASIIGRTFWLTGLLQMASDLTVDILLHIIDSLEERDFIVETEKLGRSPFADDRVFSFKHVLVRDVVYNNIPRMRRCQEHIRLALWIEEQASNNLHEFVEILVYHYQQALATWVGATLVVSHDSLDTSPPVRLTRAELKKRTITYLMMAGDKALHRYYTIRAIQTYSEALELSTDSETNVFTLAAMHEKLADAYTQRMDIERALQEYRRSLELITLHAEVTPDEKDTASSSTYTDTLLRLYDRLAELSTRWTTWKDRIDIQEVRYYIDAGLKLLADQPTSGDYSAFLTYQAMWHIRQMEMVGSQNRLELATLALESEHKALQIAEELQDSEILSLTLDALGFIYIRQQNYKEAHKVQHYRLTLADKIHSREELHDIYQSLAWVHLRTSDYPGAATWFGEGWAIAQTMESPTLLLTTLEGRMYVWYEWGHWDEAYQTARQIIQLTEQFQQGDEYLLHAYSIIAVLAYRRGEREQGDRALRHYRRLVEKFGPKAAQATSDLRIYLALEDWTRALTIAREQLQLSEPYPDLTLLTSLAELSVITGEPAEVQEAYCARALNAAQESGDRKGYLNALRARGRMYLEQQNWAAALQDLQQSHQQSEELDVPWEQGQALYCLGLFYRRRADILNLQNSSERDADFARAHYHFEKALGFFESLDALTDAERVRLVLTQDNNAPV